MKTHRLLLAAAVGTSSAFVTPANDCTVISPAPAGEICGQNGILTDPPVYPRSSTVEEVPAPLNATVALGTCRNYCLNMVNGGLQANRCIGFAYNTTSSLCTLYSAVPPRNATSLLDFGFQADSTSPVSFTSAGCFSCTLRCGLSSDINLLNNPTLNDSTALLGPWSIDSRNANRIRLTPSSKRGNAIAFLTGTESIIFDFTQPIPMCPDQDYLISVDYRLFKNPNANPSNGSYLVTIFGPQSLLALPVDDASTKSWQTVAHSTRSFPDSVAEFFGVGEKGDVILLANFNVRQVPLPSTLKTVGQPLLRNSGFESGRIAPWTLDFFGRAKSNKTAITSPGLAAQPGVARSKKKLSLSGRPTNVYQFVEGGFDLVQNTSIATERGALYVITVEWRGINCTLSDVMVGQFDFTHSTTGRYFQAGFNTISNGRTEFTSIIYSGTGLREELFLEWVEFDLGPGATSFSVDIDNIGNLRRLADF